MALCKANYFDGWDAAPGHIGYVCCWTQAQSFKYLGVELTDTADVDAKIARGRGTFTSLSTVFRSTALPIKLRVKLLQTLIVPTVLHGCECWTLSRTVCDKLNIYQSRCLRTILGLRWQEHVSNDTVRSRCEVTLSLSLSHRVLWHCLGCSTRLHHFTFSLHHCHRFRHAQNHGQAGVRNRLA